jgi:hypothetical protein
MRRKPRASQRKHPRKKAGLPAQCAMHGLRKRCLRILAEAGCNILELQSLSGHLTLIELQKYIDKADKRFAADRDAENVIAHKAKQKASAKSPRECPAFSGKGV